MTHGVDRLEGKEDEIIDRIASGETITAIALSLDMSRGWLCKWLNLVSERSARAKAARTAAAAAWDEKAEALLFDAADPFELAKARELASHYRWRAKAVAPREYGDKTQTEITGAEGGPLQVLLGQLGRSAIDPVDSSE